MAASPPSVALIGCGKMGGALLRGWLSSRAGSRFHVLEPHGLPAEFNDLPSVIHYGSAEAFAKARPPVDIFVLAVKPQVMDDVCHALAPAVAKDALLLSIAAGRRIASFEGCFGAGQPVIRSMPNTPAAIGQGVTVAVANAHAGEAQRKQADALLQAGGKVEWVSDEALLDAVTAVSGSGPAYIFLLIETLAAAGEKTGLPADLAMTLARQTVIGSAALAAHDAALPAAVLRQNVTSPGGTTEAALKILMDGRLQALFDEALDAAAARGRELSGG